MISPVPSFLAAPTLAEFMGSAALVDHFLAEQQSLTAVDRFSAYHDGDTPEQERYYRDLLPLRDPAPGEQFSFEVDLDRCSGCKSCVTACHSLNGLNEDETWREVGLLHETSGTRVQQNVTTACHHCLEPSCAHGCPTLAYEKDPVTGIVRHLDDQCFGCQYCVLKCPYDVPRFNPEKGIVRKCDMCVGRLRAGEAPACVQACPTHAIRIVLVEAASIRSDPKTAFGLPGTPDPKHSLPATRYVSRRELSKKLSPVDDHQIRPEHAHVPLVFMLVTSQMAAGFWILHALDSLIHFMPPSGFPLPECIGLGLVFSTLALSLLHLGRPWLAWKAFLGWRRSWLSREVIALTVLAFTAAMATVASFGSWIDRILPPSQSEGFFHAGFTMFSLFATALASAAVLHASAMVYRDTPRPLWATRLTSWKFALSALLCGGAAHLLVSGENRFLEILLPGALLIKLGLEARVLRHCDDDDPNPFWKAARLLSDRFGMVWRCRIALGLAGGVALPVLMALGILPHANSASVLWPVLIIVFVTGGELLERYLFFTTAIAPRMPGGR